MKSRIYKYDNLKALLIFLVVVGHMTTDYVSDSHLVRWVTLWIYSFHMPAFIFISGLLHKQYITEERAALGIKGETKLRADKVLGFFLCGYALKIFLQFSRTLMGQNPTWHWIEEPGIPWYLLVMAEYELLFYLLRHIDGGGALKLPEPNADGGNGRPFIFFLTALALSAAAGYFPAIGDAFCLSRMINFLPIYMLGYYIDPGRLNNFINTGSLSVFICSDERIGNDAADASDDESVLRRQRRRRGLQRITAAALLAVSMTVCALGKWGMYSWRKWFTGRRSYEFLQDFFSYAVKNGWWIRIAVWAVALAITVCILILMPDRDMGFITTIGARTLNVYFWHRPLCYLFRNWAVLPKLCILFGGTYNESVAGQVKGLAFGGSHQSMLAAFAVYILIAAAMTAFFSLRVFEHPCSDLMKIAGRITKRQINHKPKI